MLKYLSKVTKRIQSPSKGKIFFPEFNYMKKIRFLLQEENLLVYFFLQKKNLFSCGKKRFVFSPITHSQWDKNRGQIDFPPHSSCVIGPFLHLLGKYQFQVKSHCFGLNLELGFNFNTVSVTWFCIKIDLQKVKLIPNLLRIQKNLDSKHDDAPSWNKSRDFMKISKNKKLSKSNNFHK